MAAYLQEPVGFPDLPHDDRCDATTMGLQILRASVEVVRAVWRPPEETDELRGGYT